MQGMAPDMCVGQVQGKQSSRPPVSLNVAHHNTGNAPQESIVALFRLIVCCVFCGFRAQFPGRHIYTALHTHTVVLLNVHTEVDVPTRTVLGFHDVLCWRSVAQTQ